MVSNCRSRGLLAFALKTNHALSSAKTRRIVRGARRLDVKFFAPVLEIERANLSLRSLNISKIAMNVQ